MRYIMFFSMLLFAGSMWAEDLTKQQAYNLKEAKWHIKRAEDAKHPYMFNSSLKSAERYMKALMAEVSDHEDVVAVKQRYDKLVLQKELKDAEKKLYSAISNAKTYLRSFDRSGKLHSWEVPKVKRYQDQITKYSQVLEKNKSDYAKILEDAKNILAKTSKALGGSSKKTTTEQAPKLNSWVISRLKSLEKVLEQGEKAAKEGRMSSVRGRLHSVNIQRNEFIRMYGKKVDMNHPRIVSMNKRYNDLQAVVDGEKAKAEAELAAKRKAEAEAKAKAEAELAAKLKAETEAKAKAEAELAAKLKAEAEAKAKAEAELAAKLKAEAEAKAKAKAEAELAAKVKAEAEAKAIAEAELAAKLKAEADAKAKAEAEAKALAEAELAAKAQAEADAKAKAEAKVEAELAAKLKAEAEAKAKAEAELAAKLKAEAEAKAKAEAELAAKLEAEAEAKAKAEAELAAKLKAEAEAKAKAEAELAAKLKAEAEAKAKAAAEAAAKPEMDRWALSRLKQLEKTLDGIDQAIQRKSLGSAKGRLRGAQRQKASFVRMYSKKINMNDPRIVAVNERLSKIEATIAEMEGQKTATTQPKNTNNSNQNNTNKQTGSKLSFTAKSSVNRLKKGLKAIKYALSKDDFRSIQMAYMSMEREAKKLQSQRVPLTHPEIKPILVELRTVMMQAKARREVLMKEKAQADALAKKKKEEQRRLAEEAKKREKVDRALRDGRQRLKYANSIFERAAKTTSLSYNSNYRSAIESLDYAVGEVEKYKNDEEVKKFLQEIATQKQQFLAELVKDNSERLAKLAETGKHFVALPIFVSEIYKDVKDYPVHLQTYEKSLQTIMEKAAKRTNDVMWEDAGLRVAKREKLFNKHLLRIAKNHPKWSKLVDENRQKLIARVLQYGLDVSAKYPNMSAMSRDRHLNKHLDWAKELAGDNASYQKVITDGRVKYDEIFTALATQLAKEKAEEAERQRKEMELARKRHEAFLKSLSPKRLEIYKEWDRKNRRPRNPNSNTWVFYDTDGSGKQKVGIEHTYVFNDAGDLINHDKKTEDVWLTLKYNGKLLAYVYIGDAHGYAGTVSQDKKSGVSFQYIKISGKTVRANVGALHIEIGDKWEEVVNHNYYNSDVQVKYWASGRYAKGAIHNEKGFVIKADIDEYKKRIHRILGRTPGPEAIHYAMYFAVAHHLIR
ncbi:hypothetical protein [Candidatus Uabimicrobium amorphum]|uniref:hypothetical protein n=1 Tax=Uabimicrobium amorphum TaxID=2596890 RepID=UPI0034A289D3